MKISINWLKDYLETDHTPEEISEILTNLGLEVEKISDFESIKGGFTDGDRAVCIAFALGATEVELVGFSIDDVGQWSGVTDEKRKLIKLKWMNKVLQILSLRVDDEE